MSPPLSVRKPDAAISYGPANTYDLVGPSLLALALKVPLQQASATTVRVDTHPILDVAFTHVS